MSRPPVSGRDIGSLLGERIAAGVSQAVAVGVGVFLDEPSPFAAAARTKLLIFSVGYETRTSAFVVPHGARRSSELTNI